MIRPQDPMSHAVNLKSKFDLFSDHWAPRVIAQMNDYQFKLVKIEGEFVWLTHDDNDEMFIVHRGSMIIELRDRVLTLGPGQLVVIPRGVEHRPVAAAECEVMLLERAGLVNTGDAESDLTAENDIWI